MTLFSPQWWHAAGSRAANTAVALLIPYVAMVLAGEVSPALALSSAALGAVLSFGTSLAGLPEVTGETVSLLRAVTVRTLKTFGQAFVVWGSGAIIFSDLDLTTFSVVVLGPTFVTILRALQDVLPETPDLPLEGESQV